MSLIGTLEATIEEGHLGFTYRVANEGTDPVTLQFTSAKRCDIEVTRHGEADPCWRSSTGRMYAMVLGERTVEPGGDLVFTEHMPRPSPGRYEAVAVLAARGTDAPAEASVVLE